MESTTVFTINRGRIPEYKCHKIVRALRIIKIKRNMLQAQGFTARDTSSDEHFLIAELNGEHIQLAVAHGFMQKHCPQVGGYLVYYDDDYVSYSPQHAFEKGYALLKK